MKPALIHAGSGALGLGLVISEIAQLHGEVDIYVVNRRSTEPNAMTRNDVLHKKKHFFLRTPSGFDTAIRISGFNYSDDLGNIYQVLSEDRLLIISTALKETGLRSSLDLLIDLFSKRCSQASDWPLIFISCENAISSTQVRDLVIQQVCDICGINFDQFDSAILFLDSVVDRICNSPRVQNGNVQVSAEEYCLWSIDRKRLKKLKSSEKKKAIYDFFSKLRNVELVDDIDFIVRRKKWIVNSLHQIMALYAHFEGFYFVNDYMNTRDGEEVFDNVAEEILDIYLTNEPTCVKSDTQSYIYEVKDRFQSADSSVASALSRFKSRDQIVDFYKDMHRKIAEPTLSYMMKSGNALYWIPFILLRSIELIAYDKFVTQPCPPEN